MFDVMIVILSQCIAISKILRESGGTVIWQLDSMCQCLFYIKCMELLYTIQLFCLQNHNSQLEDLQI